MSDLNPSTEDFAALLEESFTHNDMYEGAVVKGIVVAIEKDLAVIDVGLKVEGRVPLKEFGAKGRGAGHFNFPQGLGVCPSSGDVWVCDTSNKMSAPKAATNITQI